MLSDYEAFLAVKFRDGGMGSKEQRIVLILNQVRRSINIYLAQDIPNACCSSTLSDASSNATGHLFSVSRYMLGMCQGVQVSVSRQKIAT